MHKHLNFAGVDVHRNHFICIANLAARETRENVSKPRTDHIFLPVVISPDPILYQGAIGIEAEIRESVRHRTKMRGIKTD